ncbi:glyoxalase [Polymorphobacter glacialis]|uniref:Glyoxalase n=1 Tax=Sandarakinorhabdus glacialis TaxID=1614636 RepID=A0A916ZM22_9SPHN|nr:VOC family protein [Polymorphobacter glacialis]GGE03738.1 glyoxalase [Polymorphobacter glacialis]
MSNNKEFQFCGVNHLALVCKDMAKTVEFYRDVLGMPLVKTLDLPGGRGQHFFFDMGNGDSLAFFWFPQAPEAAPGISAPAFLPTKGSFMSAHGSMNHIALNVPADKFDEYYDRLVAKGIEVTQILNHDNSPTQSSDHMHDGVFVRSVYFFDPDGVCLEFAAWTKVFDASDIAHDPVMADGNKKLGLVVRQTLAENDASLVDTMVPAE